jgi:hypothetical protein
MADNEELLREIRDLLKDIKAQNEEMAARNIAFMTKSEALATSQAAQATEALSGTRTLKWAVWVFLALLLLLFSVPTVLSMFWGSP